MSAAGYPEPSKVPPCKTCFQGVSTEFSKLHVRPGHGTQQAAGDAPSAVSTSSTHIIQHATSAFVRVPPTPFIRNIRQAAGDTSSPVSTPSTHSNPQAASVDESITSTTSTPSNQQVTGVIPSISFTASTHDQSGFGQVSPAPFGHPLFNMSHVVDSKIGDLQEP